MFTSLLILADFTHLADVRCFHRAGKVIHGTDTGNSKWVVVAKQVRRPAHYAVCKVGACGIAFFPEVAHVQLFPSSQDLVALRHFAQPIGEARLPTAYSTFQIPAKNRIKSGCHILEDVKHTVCKINE